MHLRLFLPIPSLSAPVLQGTKTEAQLGQLQKSACPPLLKIFSQLLCDSSCTWWLHTLPGCDNVNDQLSLVAFSERSRLQRTFSKGTSLINKEMAILDQIFVCLDWPTYPTNYPLQVSVASIVPIEDANMNHMNIQILINKICASGRCVFCWNFDINTRVTTVWSISYLDKSAVFVSTWVVSPWHASQTTLTPVCEHN